MRAAIIAVALVCAVASTPAVADDATRWWVRCGGPFQLCGYVEPDTLATRIPFQFEAAQPFRDGLAAVRVDGRWGYIDREGKLVIQPVWAGAAPFYGAYAEVQINGSAGIIDRNGRVVIRPQFKRIIPFADAVFIAAPLEPAARSGGYLGGQTDPMSLLSFGSAGLYHLQRGWITEADLQFSTFDDPRRGLIWAGRNEDRDTIWGLLRSDGGWAVSPRYSYVQRLFENRAVVRGLPDRTAPRAEQQGTVLSGAVDENGLLVVPIEFGWLGYWRGGYGLAGRTGSAPGSRDEGDGPSAGLVAPDGVLLAGRYFDAVDVSQDGSLPRVRLGQVWYSVNPRGDLLPDERDGTTLLACPEGPTFIRRGSQLEVRQPDGASVGLYNPGHFPARDCPGPFSLQRNGRWFSLTPEGGLVGGERGFDSLYGFDGETAAAQYDGKWGIIDRFGRFVVAPRYDELRPVGLGLYMVGQGADAQWIDATGRSVPRPQPRPDPATALDCEGGLTRFTVDGRWGMKDGAGNTVIRPEHRVLTCFSKGFAWAVSPGASEWCPIGRDGDRRRAFMCQPTVYPYVVSHHVPEKFDEDPFESNVLWNLALLDYLSGDRPEAPRWIPTARGRASHSVMDGLPIPELAETSDRRPTLGAVAPLAATTSLLGSAGLLVWSRSRRQAPQTDGVGGMDA